VAKAQSEILSGQTRQKAGEMSWQLQDAKQRFSEFVRAAERGEPQIVTRHGEEVVVVINIEEFHRLRSDGVSLMEYLRADANAPGDFRTERAQEPPRDVDLAP
jgi:prevent-host-death family protein